MFNQIANQQQPPWKGMARKGKKDESGVTYLLTLRLPDPEFRTENPKPKPKKPKPNPRIRTHIGFQLAVSWQATTATNH